MQVSWSRPRDRVSELPHEVRDRGGGSAAGRLLPSHSLAVRGWPLWLLGGGLIKGAASSFGCPVGFRGPGRCRVGGETGHSQGGKVVLRLIPAHADTSVVAPESEAIGERVSDAALARFIGDEVEVTLGVGVVIIDGGRYYATLDRQNGNG